MSLECLKGKSVSEWILIVVVGLLLVILVGLLGFCMWMGIDAVIHHEKYDAIRAAKLATEEVYESANIYSLSLNKDTSWGALFILGTGGGVGGSKPMYYFYIEESGGLKLKSYPAEEAVVVQKDGTTPRFEFVRPAGQAGYIHRLIVPTNTVKRQFNISLSLMDFGYIKRYFA